jgi:hypothetical protein
VQLSPDSTTQPKEEEEEFFSIFRSHADAKRERSKLSLTITCIAKCMYTQQQSAMTVDMEEEEGGIYAAIASSYTVNLYIAAIK